METFFNIAVLMSGESYMQKLFATDVYFHLF